MSKDLVSLIDTSHLVKKYEMDNVSGVIHVGGHHGEKIPVYIENGIRNIVLFEPLKESYDIIASKSWGETDANIAVHQVALGSTDRIAKMYLSSNDFESSSILKPKKHCDLYPNIEFSDIRDVRVRTLDSYNITDCNMLNMDVQGYELEVLKGSEKTLEYIDYIYTEVNNAEIYEGNAYINQIDDFLNPYGFKRVETSWWGDHGWGDAFYVKEKNIQNIINFEFENELDLLLTKYALDTENAKYNFDLGLWYEKNGHNSAALSYFLRASERSDDDILAYESLIHASNAYDRQGTRDHTAKGLLQQALCLLPDRPEAYYLLARFSERRQWWQDCYIFSSWGLEKCNHDCPPLSTDVEYLGKYGLYFEKAVSAWWWGKGDESRKLYRFILDTFNLYEHDYNLISTRLEEIGEYDQNKE